MKNYTSNKAEPGKGMSITIPISLNTKHDLNEYKALSTRIASAFGKEHTHGVNNLKTGRND